MCVCVCARALGLAQLSFSMRQQNLIAEGEFTVEAWRNFSFPQEDLRMSADELDCSIRVSYGELRTAIVKLLSSWVRWLWKAAETVRCSA